MADTVPAMLEPGEYVLNRNAVKAIGKNKLDKLNYDMAPRDSLSRNEYQHGGPVSILSSLLSRTQKKDKGPIYPKPEYTIPAGKNIFGQSTEKMGVDELMEMIMPTPPVGKISKTIRQLGKRGIDEYMIKPTRHEGIAKMGKLVTTGKGKKEVLENANLETLLMEVKKWARSRGIFEDVIKKQSGGEVPETLLSILSGGKYETSKDLPSIREQAIPALEFMTGAEHVPEGEEASLLNLALAIPFFGKGAKSAKAAKPALSKYYAGLFGGPHKPSPEKIKNYLENMPKWKREKLVKQTPSLRDVGYVEHAFRRRKSDYKKAKEAEGFGWRKLWDEYGVDDVDELRERDSRAIKRNVFRLMKEAQASYKKYYGMQHGGSVGDYSLTGLLMPTMDKRLGKPLMKFEHGGQVRQPGEPGYYHYMQELGQAGTTQAPPPGTTTPIPPSTTTPPSTPPAQGGMGTEGFRDWQQSWLVQPSTSTSTGIQSIFQEMGFETPGQEYLETIQAYDPTQQNRLREKIGRGMSGVEKSSFAGSGAERRDIGQKRDLLTEQYQMGAGDYRKQYREDVMAGVLDDLTQGTYDFEDLA